MATNAANTCINPFIPHNSIRAIIFNCFKNEETKAGEVG